MSVLNGENQVLNLLDLKDKKRVVEEKTITNENLSDDKNANSEDVDEEYYAALCQELLRKRFDIKTNIDDLLQSGDEGTIAKS